MAHGHLRLPPFSVTSLAALPGGSRGVRGESPGSGPGGSRRAWSTACVSTIPDGLADPVGYLRRLRELTGPDAYIVIEKILAPTRRSTPPAG